MNEPDWDRRAGQAPEDAAEEAERRERVEREAFEWAEWDYSTFGNELLGSP